MKIWSVIIASLAGFFIGYLSFGVGNKQNEIKIQEPESIDISAIKAKGFNSLKNNAALLGDRLSKALQELDTTQVELELIKQRLRDSEPKVARYNWFADEVKNLGIESFPNLGVQPKNLQPLEELLNFLGLSEQQEAQFKEISGQAYSLIKEWEEQNAVLLEQSETKSSFEIPKVPDEYRQQYLQSLETVIGSSDLNLLERAITDGFRKGFSRRIVTISLVTRKRGDPPSPSGSIFSTKIENYYKNGTSIFNNRTPYQGPDQLPERWNHLFSIEDSL